MISDKTDLEASQHIHLYEMTPSYCEPLYPIVKRERFDEDNLKFLVGDTDFAKVDRDRLSKYNKHRISGSYINVSYRLGVGCEEFNLGRLYPDDAMGLQGFRFDIRNPLARKYYWDIDMENAHYRIAVAYCKKYGLKCDYMENYVNNRMATLKLVSENKMKAKTEFLKVLYGGNIKLYREEYNEVDGIVINNGNRFLTELKKEVDNLMMRVWEENKHLHKLKTGADKKMILKKNNPKASLMSIIFQTEERKILMFMDYILQKHKRELSVFIHDGGYVQKLEGETQFPEDLLRTMETEIKSQFGYDILLSQKAIEYKWIPKSSSASPYFRMKSEFEKNHFLVGSTFVCIHKDGYVEYKNHHDMKIKCSHMVYKEYIPENEATVKKNFLAEWLADPERHIYERVDFIPDVENCPDTVYNLFKGFKAEEYRPVVPVTRDEIMELVQPILTHIDYLTSNCSGLVIKFLANIIQQPWKRSMILILLRDMGELLRLGGGTGKNFFLDWFGYSILGEDYYYVIGNNKELYGDFNSQFEGKLLIVIDEASGRDNYSNFNILKSTTTQKKLNVNKKGIAAYRLNDYSNIIACTNEKCFPTDRRIAAFDVNPAKRGDKEYFKKLDEHLEKDDVKWAFYQYLKYEIKTYASPAEFHDAIPLTPALIELRALNSPILVKWIIHMIKNGTMKDNTVHHLYEEFKLWMREFREGKEPMSLTAFGIELNRSKDAKLNGDKEDYLDEIGEKKKVNGCMKFKWNINKVIEQLIHLGLIAGDFQYNKNED